MLNFFRNIREESPSLAMLYPEITTVARKRVPASISHFRINSKSSPTENSVVEITMRMNLLFFHMGGASTENSTSHTRQFSLVSAWRSCMVESHPTKSRKSALIKIVLRKGRFLIKFIN